jgi:multiple sugar transport system substrate-binding protein
MQRNQVTRRSFLKGLATIGVGAAGAQILAACAPPAAPAGGAAQAPSTTESSAAPAPSDVSIRVQVAPGSQAAMPGIMGARYQADTGVEVVMEEVIYGEIETKTQTGYISNTLPDLLYGHHRWLFINFLKGIYADIDDMLAADAPADWDDIYPSVIAGNQLDGKNFSIPGVVHPGGNIAVMYNKDMLAEKGLPEPQDGWTMNDWEELARAAADPDAGVFGLDFDGMNSFHYYSNTSRSFGAPDSTESWVMNADGTALTYNTEMHRDIANWYSGLMDDKVAPRAADRIDGGLFPAGLNATQASIVGNVAWVLATIDGKFELDAALLPVGPEGRQGTCYSGNMHMMSSKSAHPEEAWDLMKLFSSGEAGVSMVLDGNLQPNGHKSAWTDAKVNEVNRMFGVTDVLLSAGIEPFPMPKNTRFTEANDVFRNEIDLIWSGEETFDAHAPIIEERVNAVLAQDRPA